MKPPLIYVMYDSITNPVFQGQVRTILEHIHAQDPTRYIWLVSFEHTQLSDQEIHTHIPADSPINVHILKKKSFYGMASIWYATQQLQQFLTQCRSYELIARGPLAGLVCLKSKKKSIPLTIQARGLLADEYRYTHHNTSYINKWLHSYRARQYETIEKITYSTSDPTCTIQAVSPALQKHILRTWHTTALITLATHDIPDSITPEQKKLWRMDIRAQLSIAPTTHVYCYAGSAQPWQCPDAMIAWFKKKHNEDNNNFLLVLSQDRAVFERICTAYAVPNNAYAIKTVPHARIYTYLAACDTGLLFREKHIINWVSRPTKALEYRATGLLIEHNNTVDYLIEQLFDQHYQYTQTQNQKRVDLDYQSDS